MEREEGPTGWPVGPSTIPDSAGPEHHYMFFAASLMASRIRGYVLHRHTLRRVSMSASVIFRCCFLTSLISDVAAMICPGWQYPHCGTECLTQASWTGCRSLPLAVSASPSIVVMWSVGLMYLMETEHGVKALPLMCEVQALH